MSEMNKKHDGSRTVRALKVSLVVSLGDGFSVVGQPGRGGPSARFTRRYGLRVYSRQLSPPSSILV